MWTVNIFCCVAKMKMVRNPLAAGTGLKVFKDDSVGVIADTVIIFSTHVLPLHNEAYFTLVKFTPFSFNLVWKRLVKTRSCGVIDERRTF